MITRDEERDLQDCLDRIGEINWEGLAMATYMLARRKDGASHKDAMIALFKGIIKTAEMIERKEEIK